MALNESCSNRCLFEASKCGENEVFFRYLQNYCVSMIVLIAVFQQKLKIKFLWFKMSTLETCFIGQVLSDSILILQNVHMGG